MGIKQSFLLALKSLAVSKVRALLTMLGIIIGVAAVIVIISLGAARGAMFPASILAAGVNAALGLAFFALTPLFLDPRSRPAPIRANGHAVPTAPSPAPAETAAPVPVKLRVPGSG